MMAIEARLSVLYSSYMHFLTGAWSRKKEEKEEKNFLTGSYRGQRKCLCWWVGFADFW